MLTRASASDAFSIPIAKAKLPKLCARSMTDLHKRRIDLVGAAIGDERPVELEFGKRQFS